MNSPESSKKADLRFPDDAVVDEAWKIASKKMKPEDGWIDVRNERKVVLLRDSPDEAYPLLAKSPDENVLILSSIDSAGVNVFTAMKEDVLSTVWLIETDPPAVTIRQGVVVVVLLIAGLLAHTKINSDYDKIKKDKPQGPRIQAMTER